MDLPAAGLLAAELPPAIDQISSKALAGFEVAAGLELEAEAGAIGEKAAGVAGLLFAGEANPKPDAPLDADAKLFVPCIAGRGAATGG